MIGQEIRESVFRDTRGFYEHLPPEVVSRQVLSFALEYAGKEILDLGCATGNYSCALSGLGRNVKGADINPRYVQIARERGVDAYVMEGERLPFPDRSFDTVLLFEVLEHLPDPDPVIHEARRLARENVLITTPNSGGIDELRRNGLLYEHFADLDHKNFFTESSLHALLDQNFASVAIREGDGINPFLMAPFRPIRYAGALLARLHLVPPRFYFRLYAVAEI